MHQSKGSKPQSFTVFRSAAEEVRVKIEKQAWENEGGHMKSTKGRVTHVPNAVLPYVAVLTHPGDEATEHSFATMREAEAFIKANTPESGTVLSTLYDRPASAS
jgi:hypothetical protein